jgi:hypothetical protein
MKAQILGLSLLVVAPAATAVLIKVAGGDRVTARRLEVGCHALTAGNQVQPAERVV